MPSEEWYRRDGQITEIEKEIRKAIEKRDKTLSPYQSRKRHEQLAEFILAWHIPLAEELCAYNEAIRHRNTLT